MKKLLLSILGLAAVAGCSGYDYYETDVRYRQKGNDCVYYYSEDGQKFNEDIRSLQDAKKIVYRNTKCSDLYMKDTYGYSERNDRKAIVSVFSEEKSESKCGCAKCMKKQILKNKYIIIPAYED